MKRIAARLFQVAVLLLGLAALSFLLVQPHFEGRNAHASWLQVYFNDPFLAFVYVGSIAFFAALYRGFRMAGHVGTHGVFPPSAPASFRFIRNCALVLLGFIAIGEVIILLHPEDDGAGAVALGALVGLATIAVALAASRLERSLRPSTSPA